MKPHWRDADAMELAALYAAGALSREERQAFERRLVEGHPAFRAAWKSIEPAMTLLAAGLTPVPPPARVKDAMMERIAAADSAERIDRADSAMQAPGPAFAELRDVFIQRDQDAAWRSIGLPGIRIRTLFMDRQRDLHTFLMRVEPGAELPPHPHAGAEDCYVLEGDFESFGTTFRAGDYVRAPAGSMHGASRSPSGCLVLITTAIGDDVHHKD